MKGDARLGPRTPDPASAASRLDWLPATGVQWLLPDILAGLAVWAVMVPEGMAYAGIVGVPPIMGLYTIVPPLIAYALLGNVAPAGRRPGYRDRPDLRHYCRRESRPRARRTSIRSPHPCDPDRRLLSSVRRAADGLGGSL